MVHHGVDDIFQPDVARIPGFPDEYLVFIGNRGAYKDASTLFRAFKLVHGEFPDVSLVLVGGGPFTKSEVQEIANLGLSEKVRQVSLAEGEMAGAYAHATVCVFPSQYEGFGLPALEAMACGTALILADSSSLPEVGGEAACYFPPGDAVNLSIQIRRLLSEPKERERLSGLGLLRAKEFTWGRAAARTAEVYASTLRDFNGNR